MNCLFLQQALTIEMLLCFVDHRAHLLVCNVRMSKFLHLLIADDYVFEPKKKNKFEKK